MPTSDLGIPYLRHLGAGCWKFLIQPPSYLARGHSLSQGWLKTQTEGHMIPVWSNPSSLTRFAISSDRLSPRPWPLGWGERSRVVTPQNPLLKPSSLLPTLDPLYPHWASVVQVDLKHLFGSLHVVHGSPLTLTWHIHYISVTWMTTIVEGPSLWRVPSFAPWQFISNIRSKSSHFVGCSNKHYSKSFFGCTFSPFSPGRCSINISFELNWNRKSHITNLDILGQTETCNNIISY